MEETKIPKWEYRLAAGLGVSPPADALHKDIADMHIDMLTKMLSIEELVKLNEVCEDGIAQLKSQSRSWIWTLRLAGMLPMEDEELYTVLNVLAGRSLIACYRRMRMEAAASDG